MSAEDVALVLDEAKEAMEKSIRSFRVDLQRVRTGRANPAILDGVHVDYYGTPTPLNQLANLSAPDSRLIVISPYDKELVKQIKKSAEHHKIGVREARRAAVSLLKELESDGSVPKDERHRTEKAIQDLTDSKIAKLGEMTEQKEEEILQV